MNEIIKKNEIIKPPELNIHKELFDKLDILLLLKSPI